MQCLNIKNPEVAALLKEYTEILGSENAAYYILSENNGYGLDKTPNGESSKLFNDLLKHYKNDAVKAIKAKSIVFSNQFTPENVSKGESSVDVVLKANETINKPTFVPATINNVYDKLMSSIHRRMKDIQYSKYTDPNKLDELRALEFRLNQLENDKATLEFIDYMDQDINSALDETLRILSKVKEAAKYGNDHEISNAELDLIKKGYIGFYNNIATNLQNMLDDDTTFDYFNNEQLINDTKVALKRIMGNYAELVRNFNNVVDIIAKDNFIKEATKAGSYTVDQLKNILEEGDLDINLWDQWIGSTQYSNSELVRIMMNKIIAVKNAVEDEERIKGKEL